MVQPNGRTRQANKYYQRLITNPNDPYGVNRKGQARTVPKGTGAKKIFGYLNFPLLIYNAAHKAKPTTFAPSALDRPQGVSGTAGFD